MLVDTVMKYCWENNIILCRLPSHNSHKLQSCDVSAFNPLEQRYREGVKRLNQAGSSVIGKQHFTKLYGQAQSKTFTRRNILSGWSKTGLYPFDPDKVLQTI
jgi:hypothetical protein